MLAQSGSAANALRKTYSFMEIFWSAVTCHRFGRPRPVAAKSVGKKLSKKTWASSRPGRKR